MRTQIVIRPATAADVPAIAALHAASWRVAYAAILDPDFLAGPVEADRLSVWTERLHSPPPGQTVQIAEAAERMIGFVCAYADADARWGSLVDNLHVLPAERGRGIGETLLGAAAAALEPRTAIPDLHLWVFDANEPALRFYRRLGGEVVERIASTMLAAGGKPELRVHWPDLRMLAGLRAQPSSQVCARTAFDAPVTIHSHPGESRDS